MNEITFEYLNILASQIVTISSLLAGFSIAIIANFLVTDTKTRLNNKIMVSSIFAACFFLVSLFAMTKVVMMTTEGYPMKVLINDLIPYRTMGTFSFFLGTISLLAMIAMAGWTKSKRMGIFSTTVGVITLLLILIMTT